MKLFKNRSEKIIVGIIIFLAIILTLHGLYEKRLLKRNGVYVIGKLYSSSFAGGSGWRYKYKYEFNNKFYFRSFSGPRNNKNEKDSLMFFLILPDEPEICRQILTPHVPSCLTVEMNSKGGWKNIPVNACR